MSKSSIKGRRIHISGSVGCTEKSSKAEVERARVTVQKLVMKLIKEGATFVIPIDAEKKRDDGLPICFDWLIFNTIAENLHLRPSDSINPLIIAVKHHKNENQIPEEHAAVWDKLRGSELVHIDSAYNWNMNSKRMELQAKHGDVLITIGGGEGVLFLANLYHDAAKPVIPLSFKLESENSGTQHLLSFASSGKNAKKLFQVSGAMQPNAWLNKLDISSRTPPEDIVVNIMDLLDDLVPPHAFIVRLLNPQHEDFDAVENYFATVVQPIIEIEFGYKMIVIDGEQAFDNAFVDKEIFEKLHRSHLVLADLTGSRPNCFLELGYAFGRGLPTMVLAKEGTRHPFDISTYSGLHWKTSGSVAEKREAFRKHWNAIQQRPPIVDSDPLIQ